MKRFAVVLCLAGVVFGCSVQHHDRAPSVADQIRPSGVPSGKPLTVTTTNGIDVQPPTIHMKAYAEWARWNFPQTPADQRPRIVYEGNVPFDDPTCYLDQSRKWVCESSTFSIPCDDQGKTYEIKYTIHIDGSGLDPLDPKIIVDP